MPPIALIAAVMMALLLAGCGQATARAAEELPAYAEESEYFVSTVRGLVSRAQAATTGVTHYFQTSRSRLCYSFRVPGTWELGREPRCFERELRELGGIRAR